MAFDRNDSVQAAHASSAILLVRAPDALSRRIAGVAAVSRQLVELARAGFAEAVIVAEPDEGLAGQIRADLQRAGQSLVVRFSTGAAQPARGAIALDGAIVKAAALEALVRLDDAAVALRLGSRIVARRIDDQDSAELASNGFWAAVGVDESHIAVAQPGQAIPLDCPVEAARLVLRDTAKRSDGLVSRYLNRPISRLLSGWLLRLWPQIRPGHATFLTAVTAVCMFLSLAHGTPMGLVLGCLLFHAASIIDGLDGEIARATYRTSAFGAVLDTAVDMSCNLSFAVGLTIGVTRLYGPAYLQIGAFCSLGLLAGIVSMTLLSRRNGGGGSFDILKAVYGARAEEEGGLGVVNAVRTATSRDFFAFVFAVMGLFGLVRFIPWILAFGVSLWLLIILGGVTLLLNDQTGPVRR